MLNKHEERFEATNFDLTWINCYRTQHLGHWQDECILYEFLKVNCTYKGIGSCHHIELPLVHGIESLTVHMLKFTMFFMMPDSAHLEHNSHNYV